MFRKKLQVKICGRHYKGIEITVESTVTKYTQMESVPNYPSINIFVLEELDNLKLLSYDRYI